MDVESAVSSIDAIESALRDLEPEYAGASFLRKLFFIRYPLPRHAVPVSFLKSFLVSERARRAYLSAPSQETARALLDAWDACAEALSQDIARYRTLHDILLRLESTPETFVMQDMFGHLTSYGYVERTLTTLARNAAALQEEVAYRRRVFEGRQAGNSRAQRKAAPLPVLEKGEVSPWHKELHAAEIAGGTWPYRYVDIVESHGPFRSEMSNVDESPRNRTFFFYVTREKDSGKNSMWIAFVDRFYVIDIWHMLDVWSKNHLADGVTRGKYATAVGLEKDEIPFWYEITSLLYNTRDLRYWMDIASAVDAKRRPGLDWRLATAQRSSLFDLLLAECARDTRSMIAHLRRRARGDKTTRYSMMYDLLTRSYPSVYYLPFNASVWRLPEKLDLLGDGFQAPPPDKFLSDERMKKELTPEVLKKVMGVARLREERGKAAGWLP
jgi:hypothetical protein